ncbi:MAG TPA: N-acyl homoserine lactonase family protein [Syntrophorhabdales bacterium]|nr:N-acyl homoserine lactonase family protein [Syntrophorhabdales bacterium]
MKLYVFESAKMHVPDRGMMSGRPSGVPVTIPVPFYLIDHPKGLALFDTGMKLDNWPAQYKQDGDQRPDQMIDVQLAACGFKLDDIKYVIMSHLHLDHAGGMPLFPKATFIVRKSELRAAWWPERFQVHYIFDDYKETRNFSFIELDDTEVFDVFQDGSVLCIDTKGHSQGHQSLVVNLPRSGRFVLTADAAAMAEILDEGVLPAIAWNAEEALRSLRKMQHMKREGATVLMAHDPDQWEKTRLAPEYYD